MAPYKDYARTEDSNVQKELQNEIIKAYKARSEPVVMVPGLSPKQRVDFILRNL